MIIRQSMFLSRLACLLCAQNAYADDAGFGSGWQCNRGFRQTGSGCATSCVALTLPPNAYVDYSGNDWECIDGFIRQRQACIPD